MHDFQLDKIAAITEVIDRSNGMERDSDVKIPKPGSSSPAFFITLMCRSDSIAHPVLSPRGHCYEMDFASTLCRNPRGFN